jgi:hypothetical protein
VEPATAILFGAKFAKLFLGEIETVRAAEKEAKFGNVGRMSNAVDGTVVDSGESQFTLILVAEHDDRRMDWEVMDCVDELEAVVVRVACSLAEINDENIRPREQLLKACDGRNILIAKNETFAESTT